MRKLAFGLLFCFHACAPKTSPVLDSRINELINGCWEHIEQTSPYTTNHPGSSPNKPGTQVPLSVEAGKSICAPGPCPFQSPFDKYQFDAFVYEERQRQKAKFASFRTDKTSDGRVEITTATLKGTKLGMAYKAGKVIVLEQHYSHVAVDGKPCGTWKTYTK